MVAQGPESEWQITNKILTNAFGVQGSLWKKLKECKKQKVLNVAVKCWPGLATPTLSWPHRSCGYLHLTYGSLGPSTVSHGLGGGVEPFFLLLKYRLLIHSEGVNKTSSWLLNPLNSSPSLGGWFQIHSQTDAPDKLSESQKQRGRHECSKRNVSMKEVSTGRRSIREGWKHDTSQNTLYIYIYVTYAWHF